MEGKIVERKSRGSNFRKLESCILQLACGKAVAKRKLQSATLGVGDPASYNPPVKTLLWKQLRNDDCGGKIAGRKYLEKNLAIRLNWEVLLRVGSTTS